MIPKRWTKNDDSNLSTIINPDRSFAITVASGDDGTGRVEAMPQTKYPKGIATKHAVNSNQLFLFQIHDENEADLRLTWMLLRRRDVDTNTVFAELSLPKAMTEEGQVEDWITRIILDPIDIEPTIDIQDDSSEPPIEVPVRRRS